MGFWGSLGKGLLKVAKVAAPIVLGATGVGLPAAMAVGGGLNALDKKVSGGSWGDTLKSGLMGAGTSALGGMAGKGASGFIKSLGSKLAGNAIKNRIQGGAGSMREQVGNITGPSLNDFSPGIMPSKIFGSNMGMEYGPTAPSSALNMGGSANSTLTKILGSANNIAKSMGNRGPAMQQNWMAPYMRGAGQPRMPYMFGPQQPMSQTQNYQKMGVAGGYMPQRGSFNTGMRNPNARY